MTQGRRAIGGHLSVTRSRVLFRAQLLDRLTGGKTVEVPLRRVVEVGIADRTAELFAGGLRKRLRLLLDDQSELLFVVNHVDDVVAAIEHARGS